MVGIVSTESNVDPTSYNTLITIAVYNKIEQWVKADDTITAIPSLPATPLLPATPSPPVTIQDHHWFDRRSADLSELNNWTHRLDANSLQLNNRSMAFINSPEFQRELGYWQAAQDTTFAGLSTFAATNPLYEHGFPQVGANWTGHIQAAGSMGHVGFTDRLQNHISDTGAGHDARVHTS